MRLFYKFVCMFFAVTLLFCGCSNDTAHTMVSEEEYAKASLHLPVLRLSGDVTTMTKDESVLLDVSFIHNDKSFQCKAKTKWQGSSSLSYPKKNYSVKFVDEDGNAFNLSFKDWYATNSFHLKANYYDYSMVRNSVASEWGRRCFPEAYPNDAKGSIDSFPFVLYLNDEWLGCYTWNLPQDEKLFNMDENDENQMAFRPNNEGWEVANFEIRSQDEATSHQQEKLSRMVNWTKTCTNKEFTEKVNEYFNLSSLINYWLFMDVGCCGDSMVNNSTWATWDGEIWYVLWYDVDVCFGQNPSMYPADIDLLTTSKTEEWAHKYNPVWEKLYANFYEDLCSRYAELRQTEFKDTDSIIQQFTDFRDTWGNENIKYEHLKWEHFMPDDIDSPETKSWIENRLAYCDAKYQYCVND